MGGAVGAVEGGVRCICLLPAVGGVVVDRRRWESNSFPAWLQEKDRAGGLYTIETRWNAERSISFRVTRCSCCC